PPIKSEEELRTTSLMVFETKKHGIPETQHLATEPKTGIWGRTVLVHSFDDIVSAAKERAASTGKLAALGILVHGDAGGQFTVGGKTFTVENLPMEKLKELATFLAPDANVYLYGCISAVDKAGSVLLKTLSEALPGRLIIGFVSLNDLEAVNVRLEGSFFSR